MFVPAAGNVNTKRGARLSAHLRPAWRHRSTRLGMTATRRGVPHLAPRTSDDAAVPHPTQPQGTDLTHHIAIAMLRFAVRQAVSAAEALAATIKLSASAAKDLPKVTPHDDISL